MALRGRARSVPAVPARLLAAAAAAVAVAVALAGVSPAFASLSGEVSAGQAVAAQVQIGKASCDTLSDTQFEHLGEYVMDRMVGSRAAHEAMNARMTEAIGAQNTHRMHEVMGRRFAGCATAGATAGVPMGPGMMGGGSGYGGGWGMMSGSGWSWMHNGTWQRMSQSQWRQLAGTMMGARYTSGHHGWSTGAVVAVVMGALLLGALLAVLLVRRPWHRRPPAAPSTA